VIERSGKRLLIARRVPQGISAEMKTMRVGPPGGKMPQQTKRTSEASRRAMFLIHSIPAPATPDVILFP
jgi:hypothetical protein